MPDDNAKATEGATGTGGGAGDERDKWSRADWERHTQSESDRRVTEVLKKKEEEYKTLLADAGKTAESKLKDYEAQLTSERTRAEFMAASIAQGVGDPKAAWAVVREYGLTDAKGAVDFARLKVDYPSLFAASANAKSVAGRQGDQGTGGKIDMNTLLRGAAIGG